MRSKIIFLILLLSVGSFIGLVWYYHIDWSDLATLSFYENLADPSVRIVRVPAGLRKEQIAEIMADKLKWGEFQKLAFVNAHTSFLETNLEGHYFPKTYMIQKDENAMEVSSTKFKEFTKETSTLQKPKTSKVLNEDTALTVASIIQREAAGPEDMKLVSGIIWNRIFAGMKLQMDSTLQYAKGNEEDGWWTEVTPKDKSIDSPYNTYKHKDVPPTPISNPSLTAISAAYNPQKTTCLYYLHDKNRNIHCSATYEGHLKNIKKYY